MTDLSPSREAAKSDNIRLDESSWRLRDLARNLFSLLKGSFAQRPATDPHPRPLGGREADGAARDGPAARAVPGRGGGIDEARAAGGRAEGIGRARDAHRQAAQGRPAGAG